MAKQNTTTTANMNGVREVDFVSRFATNWQSLRDILGVSRLVRKAPGTVLKTKFARVQLANGAVGEGEEIPYSQATVGTKDFEPIVVEKYAKGVSIEAIAEHGYDAAIGLTDDQFLTELNGVVLGKFFTFVNTGSLVSDKTTFQAALAEAQGRVRNKWKKMHKGITDIVGFCNMLDAYDYLGAANITVQTAFGMSYIENFLGYSKLFLCADTEVARGKVLATPVENLILYYVSPDDSDFAKAGLEFRTDGELNLIGFHVQGNYGNAVSESFALMGMVLMAEYVDGIAAVDIGTATFAAVSSPSGNPSEKNYFEKVGTDYVKSTDATVVSGKTYYTRTVSTGA